MKYRVPLKIVFDGYAIVEAKDESQAEEIACYNVGATLGSVSDNLSDKVLDHEFDLHGETYLSDNESIEDFTDDEINEYLKE